MSHFENFYGFPLKIFASFAPFWVKSPLTFSFLEFVNKRKIFRSSDFQKQNFVVYVRYSLIFKPFLMQACNTNSLQESQELQKQLNISIAWPDAFMVSHWLIRLPLGRLEKILNKKPKLGKHFNVNIFRIHNHLCCAILSEIWGSIQGSMDSSARFELFVGRLSVNPWLRY